MGLLGKKYKNSEEIFADVAYHENRKKLEAILYKMIEDGVDDENFRREDLIVLEAMNTLAEKVDLYYIGGVSERLKKLLLPLLKKALQTKEESKYIHQLSISDTFVTNLKDLYKKLLSNRSNYIQKCAAVAAILAYTRYRWYPNEAEEFLSEIANLDDKEYYALIEAAIVSSREEHGISRAEESANDDLDETEDTSDYSPSDGCDYTEPQLTKKQIAARKRLRKGTAHEVSHTKSTDASSPPRAKADSNTYRDPIPAVKQSKASNKPGKGKLIGKIILKTICCIFGLAIIALAVVQFVTTKAQVSEDERISILMGQVASGAFCLGLWLFYYGTIVALKKAGIRVRDDLKAPSFWEIVSVTTVTTHYSDGSTEEKKYSNIKGSFLGEIVVFLVIFVAIQTYYFVAAPVLGLISLFRDIKDLKE